MIEPTFGPAEFQAAAKATEAQMADLSTYLALLADWNGRMNLVGPSALDAFWLRHAWDSAQLLAFAPHARIWADIGAGAGFPGLVLAVLLKQKPGVRVHLIESMTKRCGFLSAVAQNLNLPASVHNERAENTPLKGIEVVTARACAPMITLLTFAEPFLRQGATGLFLKGKTIDIELAEARKVWTFRAELSPSLSDPSGRVVKVQGVSRG